MGELLAKYFSLDGNPDLFKKLITAIDIKNLCKLYLLNYTFF
jgi:hypothetical protein